MKKNYIIPSVSIVDCGADAYLLIQSVGMGEKCAEGEIVTADGNVRGAEEEETWGNLW